MHYQYRMH